MFKKILVPLDGSELAERAIGYATALSIPTGASLVLVRAAAAHVLPGFDEREPQTREIADAEQYLTESAARLTRRGFAVETGCPYGETPASWIVEEVDLRNADLITMTTHGRTGPGRWLFATVTEQVVARSPVPVLVERGWLPRHRELLLQRVPRLLVTLDGSSFAEAALGAAAGLADAIGAELVLLHVGALPGSVAPNDYASLSELRIQHDAESRHTAALDYLNGVADRMAHMWPALSVRVDVRQGEAADEIVAAAMAVDAALVVMATHGRTGLVRSVMGSIAGAVLQCGATPLVLVNPATLAERFRLPDSSSVHAA